MERPKGNGYLGPQSEEKYLKASGELFQSIVRVQCRKRREREGRSRVRRKRRGRKEWRKEGRKRGWEEGREEERKEGRKGGKKRWGGREKGGIEGKELEGRRKINI